MTNIELEVARTQILANQAVASLADVNWEERRYEIAKDFMCSRISGLDYFPSADSLSKTAIEYADALISELKKQ